MAVELVAITIEEFLINSKVFPEIDFFIYCFICGVLG